MGQLVTGKHEVAKTDIKVEIKRGIFNIGGYSANHIRNRRGRSGH